MSRIPPLALLLGLALAAPRPASGRDDDRQPPPRGTTVPSDPTFVALLTDGTTESGQVRGLGTGGGDEGGVTLVGPDRAGRKVPLDRLVKLTREGVSPPSQDEGGGVVVFPDGDRLAYCRIGAAGETRLDVHSTPLENLAIPIDSILGLILESPAEAEAASALAAKVRSEPRNSDLLWLANGDKLPGLFSGLDEKKVAFQPATGRIELERVGVVAIGFDPARVDYRRPAGPFFELTLVDGSRLGVSAVRFERGQVVGRARFGAEARLPIGDLAQVHVLGGRVSYLSDREPDRFVYEPYLGPTRPHRRGASVAGTPLRLGGRTFDRGIGTQSRTLLLYKLGPDARRFQALVGLDDGAGPLGSVGFKVIVDGKVRYESPAMGAKEPPKAIDVDIAGGSLLVLITEFGERGDIQDGADWVEARIIH